MIDRQTAADELRHARHARLEAEAAWCDVEELLWEMQHSPRIWRRLALMQVDDETAPPALAHDPEKWAPVFGKDHAQAKCWNDTAIQSNWIRL